MDADAGCALRSGTLKFLRPIRLERSMPGENCTRNVGLKLPMRCRGPALPTEQNRKPLFAQNLLHGFALGKLVDELVQIADFPHGFVLDFFHPNAAHHAFNQAEVTRCGHVSQQRRLPGISRSGVSYVSTVRCPPLDYGPSSTRRTDPGWSS